MQLSDRGFRSRLSSELTIRSRCFRSSGAQAEGSRSGATAGYPDRSNLSRSTFCIFEFAAQHCMVNQASISNTVEPWSNCTSSSLCDRHSLWSEAALARRRATTLRSACVDQRADSGANYGHDLQQGRMRVCNSTTHDQYLTLTMVSNCSSSTFKRSRAVYRAAHSSPG